MKKKYRKVRVRVIIVRDEDILTESSGNTPSETGENELPIFVVISKPTN